jgi:hypothetical protein
MQFLDFQIRAAAYFSVNFQKIIVVTIDGKYSFSIERAWRVTKTPNRVTKMLSKFQSISH